MNVDAIVRHALFSHFFCSIAQQKKQFACHGSGKMGH